MTSHIEWGGTNPRVSIITQTQRAPDGNTPDRKYALVITNENGDGMALEADSIGEIITAATNLHRQAQTAVREFIDSDTVSPRRGW